MANKSFITKVRDGILICIFVGLIGLPLLGSFIGFGNSNDLEEKRVLSKCPVLGVDPIDTIPDDFEAFFKDHFGFRNEFIRGYNWFRYKLFKGRSFGKVFMGKDDWLFLTKSDIFADYLGQTPLTPDELVVWQTVLEQRQQWLTERGIGYLFVVVPNKAMIYSEMLPDHIYRNKGQTKMDQLVDHLTKNSTVEFLDLRDALSKAKDTGLLYHPRDSHWNDRGAFVVYYQICNRLTKWFPDIHPWLIEDFTVTVKRHVGDLAIMLGLGEELVLESEFLVPEKTRNASQINPANKTQPKKPALELPYKQITFENKNAKHRLLLFHDSFGNFGGFREYLAEHFFSSTFIHAHINKNCLELMVKQEHPDIVIEEIVERNLEDILTLNEKYIADE